MLNGVETEGLYGYGCYRSDDQEDIVSPPENGSRNGTTKSAATSKNS